MRKIIFVLVITVMILIDLHSLFSKKYVENVINSRTKLSRKNNVSSIAFTIFIMTVLIGLLVFYLGTFVDQKLCLGFAFLECISIIIALVYPYTNILNDKGFFILDKLIAVIEIGMLLEIGYTGISK